MIIYWRLKDQVVKGSKSIKKIYFSFDDTLFKNLVDIENFIVSSWTEKSSNFIQVIN